MTIFNFTRRVLLNSRYVQRASFTDLFPRDNFRCPRLKTLISLRNHLYHRSRKNQFKKETNTIDCHFFVFGLGIALSQFCGCLVWFAEESIRCSVFRGRRFTLGRKVVSLGITGSMTQIVLKLEISLCK